MLPDRISELEVEDENEIKWEELAGGWSSVRSPQWLRSKWWSIKRQVANHKEIPFSGTRGSPVFYYHQKRSHCFIDINIEKYPLYVNWSGPVIPLPASRGDNLIVFGIWLISK